MDELLKPSEGSRGAYQFFLSVVAGIGGLKVVSVLVNKVWERYINQDRYRHEDYTTSEDRAWKLVAELKLQIKDSDVQIVKLIQDKYAAEHLASVTDLRLQSQIEQNTRLCEEKAGLEEQIEDLEAHVSKLLNQLHAERAQRGIGD